MDTLTLRPGKKKWVKLLLISSAFVIGGGWMIAQHIGPAFMSWGATLFFGLGMFVAIAMLIPGRNELVLTQEGFSRKINGRIHPQWTIKWRDLEDFTVVPVSLRKGLVREVIGINYAPAARTEMASERLAKMDRLRKDYDCDGAMPDIYDMTVSELVTLLNEWRLKHS